MSDMSKGERSWDKHETIGRFLRDITIVAVLCIAGLAWYKKKTDDDIAAHELAKEGSALLTRDNPADLKAAIVKLEEALAIRPKHDFALASLAEVHAILHVEHLEPGDHAAKAEEYLERAERYAPNLPQRYSAQAILLLGEGKAEEAEQFLIKNVLEEGAGDARIFTAIAQAQREQGKLREAKRSGRAASDSDWRNPRFSRVVGDIYAEEGDHANALAFYGKALSSYSDHLASDLGKARVQIRRGQELETSAQAVDKALAAELTPALRAVALTGKAELLLVEQKADEALEKIGEAKEADPNYPWAYALEAMAKVIKEDVDGAVEAYDKAIEVDKHIASFYFDAATLMAAVNREEKAVEYLDAYALRKDDTYFMNYGNVLRRLQKFDEALARYDEAIEQNELNADAYVAKAAILIHQEKYDEAEDALERAVTASPHSPEAFVEKGNLLFAKGQYELGVQEFATALSQWKQGRAPQEQLVAAVQMVKQKLLDARQRNYAASWEREATNLIR